MLDNHLFHGNPRGIDPSRLLWPRALDSRSESSSTFFVRGVNGGEPVGTFDPAPMI